MLKVKQLKKILVGTTFLIFLSSTSVQASTHTIKPGESLYKISKTYGVTLTELRKSNNKWDDLIYPGETLSIPGKSVSDTSKIETKEYVIPCSKDELDLMARLIRAEAENQPYTAKVAVGSVVVNRVKNEKFPNTITSVINQKDQFTPVKNGMINKSATSETISAAKEALQGKDPTNGALFFYDTSVKNQWLLSKAKALSIEQLVFAY